MLECKIEDIQKNSARKTFGSQNLLRALSLASCMAALSLLAPKVPSLIRYNFMPACSAAQSIQKPVPEEYYSKLSDLASQTESVYSERHETKRLLKNQQSSFFKSLDNNPENYLMVVDKKRQIAKVYRFSFELVDISPVSTGKVAGEKNLLGDNKTPSGIFSVVSQQDSSGWVHNGEAGAYGNYFSRLDAGSWDSFGNHFAGARSSIGIHGTSRPEQLGLRASEGCIRLPNNKNDWYVASGILQDGTLIAILPEELRW